MTYNRTTAKAKAAGRQMDRKAKVAKIDHPNHAPRKGAQWTPPKSNQG